ncbi:hypothetical protein [Botrimarina hoheduenensis]|uniref:hypothetical protein n=1 Tax=Botrimarina hoheduenensis TaxID=2528000 RepID=UPI0018D32BA3|nr:hypothetical protein [Botrimarina hoheduenensis]
MRNSPIDPSTSHSNNAARLRWAVYTVLIALALGQAAGKILAVNSVDLRRLEDQRVKIALERERVRLEADGMTGVALELRLEAVENEVRDQQRLQRPFLSANDRSRWLAIRALAEQGTFEIDRLLEERTWDTIDMVQHANRDGELRLYSSKPPLLMVLIAGPYWLLMQLTGMTLGTHPYAVGRTLLLAINGGALALLLSMTAVLIERHGRGDLGRLLAMAVACFGTLLSAFTPVLNNHLIAAAATAAACVGWSRLRASDQQLSKLSLLTGIAAAFAAANELPALGLTVLLGASLAIRRPLETLTGYLPGAALVGVAFFATNYWAHDSWRPPYAHRSTVDPSDNWYDYEYTLNGRTRESYWRNPKGVDIGEPSKGVYAFHTLVGKYGVFSLTPIWVLSVAGGAWLIARGRPLDRELALITLAITAACLVFYLGLRPQADRNYGGATSGLRWLFWLAPLWVTLIPPAAQGLSRRRAGLALACTLLVLSALSAAYPTWNPWQAPWIADWADALVGS